MRVRRTSQGMVVRAVAGAHVVLLGMDLERAQCAGLMGFAIHRTDHTENEAYWLEGLKTFASTDPHLAPGKHYPTNAHPIQGFTWSDFSAKPGHRYTYRVRALKGPPEALKKFRQVEVTVVTESAAGSSHQVHFNRGAAASQEYARRFKQQPPLERAPADDPRWAWLSRGAAEAILAFIARATGPGAALRVSAYEFRWPALAQALKAAIDRGVDVQVLHDASPHLPDAKTGRVFPRDDNLDTAAAAGLGSAVRPRITRSDVKSPPISHHKFIVLLQAGKPRAVLTGSTNFSNGGVYGQSNVVHVVENTRVARAYLRCWEQIAVNPSPQALRAALAALNLAAQGLPPAGTGAIFSPQSGEATLRWYAELAAGAEGALMMTFAFGMNALFRDAYRSGKAALRYALLDKLLGSGVAKDKRAAAEAEMLALRMQVENRFAVGNRLVTNLFDRWLSETLTGLNSHVQYIHTKFMLIDPLGEDPIVISGSANFSEASTTDNDENMLVVRGDTRVADVYLGEYMRLWNHYAFREWAASPRAKGGEGFQHLDVADQWWRGYFGNNARSRQRQYFAATIV